MAVGTGVVVGAGVDVGIGVAVGNGVGKTFAATVGRAESASLMRSLTISSFSSLEGTQATDSRTIRNRAMVTYRNFACVESLAGLQLLLIPIALRNSIEWPIRYDQNRSLC